MSEIHTCTRLISSPKPIVPPYAGRSFPAERLKAGILLSIWLLGSLVSTQAATVWTWNGTGSNNWSAPGDWSGGSVPTSNGGTSDPAFPNSVGDILLSTTGGTGGTIATLDIAAEISTLTFSTSTTGGSSTLAVANGSALTIDSGITSASANASRTNIISPNIVLGGNNTWNVTGGLSARSVISETGGSHAINLTGTGTIQMGTNGNAASTFTGGVDVNMGTGSVLQFFNNSAFGQGSAGTSQLRIVSLGTLGFNNTALAAPIVFNTCTTDVSFQMVGITSYFGLQTSLPSISGNLNNHNWSLGSTAPSTWTFNSVNVTNIGSNGLQLAANNSAGANNTYIFTANPTISGTGAGNGLIQLGNNNNTAGGASNLLLNLNNQSVAFSQTKVAMGAGVNAGKMTMGGIQSSGTTTVNTPISIIATAAGSEANFVSLNPTAVTDFTGPISGTATSANGVYINDSFSQIDSAATKSSASAKYTASNPTGTVRFSHATGNSYTGTTKVAAGKFWVANTSGSATGLGAVTINGGASLIGNGIIAGMVTADSNTSVFSPGDGTTTSTLNLVGGLTALSGAIFNFGINGNSIDEINFGSGDVTLGGALTFNFTNLGSIASDQIYTLFTGTGGAWTSTAAFTFNLPTGYSLNSDYNGGLGYLWDETNHALTVEFSAVPEVSTWLLTAMGAFVLFVTKRGPRRLIRMFTSCERL